MMKSLDVACNDPDNGNFLARAPQLMIGNAEFEANRWNYTTTFYCPIFNEIEGGFKISGKHFRTAGSKGYYGNWCWNRYYMTSTDEMIDFVLWLRDRGLFSCTTASEKFYNWFNSSEIVSRESLAGIIGDLNDV